MLLWYGQNIIQSVSTSPDMVPPEARMTLSVCSRENRLVSRRPLLLGTLLFSFRRMSRIWIFQIRNMISDMKLSILA